MRFVSLAEAVFYHVFRWSSKRMFYDLDLVCACCFKNIGNSKNKRSVLTCCLYSLF